MKWPTKNLGELFDFKNGRGFSKTEWSDSGTPIIRIQNLNNTEATFNYFKGSYDKDIEVIKNDLLFSWSGTVGSSFGSYIWKGPQGVLNQHIYKVNFKRAMDKKFAFYALQYITKDVENKVSGAVGLVHITKEKLNRFTIIYPPVPDQKRIASNLNESFAAIDKAKSSIEKNIQNTKELFESYLQYVFTSNNKNWKEKNFDEVCILQRGFDLPTRLRADGEFPLVSSNGITDKVNAWKVKGPGVVTGRSGTIGSVHYIEKDFWPLNTALYIKDFHHNDIRFIYYFLKQFDLSKYSSGAGVPTLNRNNVHSIKVCIPEPITEQKSIVAKLDSLSAETKKLEALYQKKLSDLEELKKSILKKAFAGEL